jgi:cell division initiation protein
MLRPIDIQNKDFEKKLKGYDTDQVDDFLDAIIHDYEIILKENQTLKDRTEVLAETVESYKKIEKTLDAAAQTARETAEGIVANANMEAENIIHRAKLEAQNLSRQIDEEHIKKQNEMRAMRSEIDAYKARIRSICTSIVEMSADL